MRLRGISLTNEPSESLEVSLFLFSFLFLGRLKSMSSSISSSISSSGKRRSKVSSSDFFFSRLNFFLGGESERLNDFSPRDHISQEKKRKKVPLRGKRSKKRRGEKPKLRDELCPSGSSGSLKIITSCCVGVLL